MNPTPSFRRGGLKILPPGQNSAMVPRVSRSVLLLVGAALCALSLSATLLSPPSRASGVTAKWDTASPFLVAQAVELDGFEAEGIPASDLDDDGFDEVTESEPKNGDEAAGDSAAAMAAKPKKPSAPYVPWSERGVQYWLKLFDDFATVVVHEYKGELLLLLVASLYALNYVMGSRRNEGIVLEWANTFGLQHDATVYGRNFALVGLDTKTSASEIIFRESQSRFKCYATGRRHLDWAMTTLELRRRQDLLSEAINLVKPQKDKLVVEVSVPDASMPPMVFAIVRKKLSKAFASDHKDIKKFASVVTDPQAVLAASKATSGYVWPKKKLVVFSESKEVFASLASESALRNVFDHEIFSSRFERHFESLYFTSEGPVPGMEPAKNLLRFEFSLPRDPKRMADLAPLMELVFHEVDLVGSLRLSPETAKKATKRRKEVEEELFKESLQQRQEEAQRRREEKYQKEKATMNPAQVAKAEEKRKQKILKKSRPKMKMQR